MIGLDMAEIVMLYEMYRKRSLGERYIVSQPTVSSLAVIKSEIGCDLPSDFVSLAEACPSYTNAFALIGEDVAAVLKQKHIISLYHEFLGDYVHLTYPHSDRATAFHKSEPEGAIYTMEWGRWTKDGKYVPPKSDRPDLIEQVAQNFREYLGRYVCLNAIGSRASLLQTLAICKRPHGDKAGVAVVEQKLRELDERREFVISILNKYSASAQLISEIEKL
jgi:hypothetical protein